MSNSNLIFTTSLDHLGSTFDRMKISRKNGNGIILGHLRIADSLNEEGKHGHFIFIDPTTYKLYVGDRLCREEDYTILSEMLAAVVDRMTGKTIEASELKPGSFINATVGITGARMDYKFGGVERVAAPIVAAPIENPESISNFGIF